MLRQGLADAVRDASNGRLVTRLRRADMELAQAERWLAAQSADRVTRTVDARGVERSTRPRAERRASRAD